MFLKLLFLELVFSCLVLTQEDIQEARMIADTIGADLIAKLRNDPYTDLQPDEEYEDLKAELFAYHAALVQLTESQQESGRRLYTTPCWKLGGICVDLKLCEGEHYLTQIPGCKDKKNVCCFSWNKFKVHPMEGISNLGYPWGHRVQFGPSRQDESGPRKPVKLHQIYGKDEDGGYHSAVSA